MMSFRFPQNVFGRKCINPQNVLATYSLMSVFREPAQEFTFHGLSFVKNVLFLCN